MRIRKLKATGFTLVEVMIALVLGSLIVLAIVSLFLGNYKNYRLQEAMSRSQENMRFAVDILSESLREVGAVGCGNLLERGPTPLFLPPQQPTPEIYTGDTLITGAPGVSPSFSTTDTITMMTATSCGAKVMGQATMTAGNDIIIAADTCDLEATEDLLISDCQNAHVFTPSAVSGTTITIGGVSGTSRIYQSNIEGDAEVFRIETKTYSIRPGQGGQRGLFETISRGSAPVITSELIEGIDDMQIRYGLDTDLDGVVDGAYETAASVTAGANWADVISVKVYLLTVSITDNLLDGVAPGSAVTFPFADGVTLTASAADRRLRRPFTQVIGLRNRIDP